MAEEEKIAELIANVDAEREEIGLINACKKYKIKPGKYHYWLNKLGTQKPKVEITDLAQSTPKKPLAQSSKSKVVILICDAQSVGETLKGLL